MYMFIFKVMRSKITIKCCRIYFFMVCTAVTCNFFFTDNDMSDDHDDDTDDDDDDLLPAYQHKDPTSVYCHAVHVSPR